MLKEKLKKYNIILASGSPRRQQFFKDLGLDFEIRLKPVVEDYPDRLTHFEISNYLAELKSLPFEKDLTENDILITSDTIVWHNNKAIGKPYSEDDAFKMITSLSNQTHEVITSVCLKTLHSQKTIHAVTKVTFKALSDEEIWYYIKNFNPMDKAGGYGIQEWFGYIAVTKIEGSFFNVMGLPVHMLYESLIEIANKNIG
ncbi:MAG: septum formation protein Maf [Flavobacteriaceae bacterium]|nr:septum formation protein Maf [Flavobacteriaceae bacterium]